MHSGTVAHFHALEAVYEHIYCPTRSWHSTLILVDMHKQHTHTQYTITAPYTVLELIEACTHYSTYQPLKKNHQTLGTQCSLSSSELQLSQYIQEWGVRRGRGTVTCRKPTHSLKSLNTFTTDLQLASFPGLPRLRFLITCSMRKLLAQFLHTASDQKPEPEKACQLATFNCVRQQRGFTNVI